MTPLNTNLKDLSPGQKLAFVGVVLLLALIVVLLKDKRSSPMEIAPPSQSPKETPAERAALLLGGSVSQAAQIDRISRHFGEKPETVADKAAKSAELCGQPGNQAMAFSALTFVDTLLSTADKASDMNELFVLFVASGCPI